MPYNTQDISTKEANYIQDFQLTLFNLFRQFYLFLAQILFLQITILIGRMFLLLIQLLINLIFITNKILTGYDI